MPPDTPTASETITTDLCVIGAGSGGLSVAAAAALMQVPVVLIEKSHMGGDCLNVGCVPSKALIAAGKQAAMIRKVTAFGFNQVEVRPAFNRVMAHVQDVIASIAPNDSVARFEALGVKVIKAEARFVDGRTVAAGPHLIRARRFVIATGSRPAIPAIEGLETVPYLTNETLFGLTRRPRSLLVIGAGPIGAEMAQAFARLGSEVTVVGPALMPREDAEAARIVRLAMERDGVRFHLDDKVVAIKGEGEALTAVLASGVEIAASHVLVAAGRTPTTEALALDKAGIRNSAAGIVVDAQLRTSNAKVHAIGDVVGPPQFTHRANYHAGLVIRSALFRMPVDASKGLIPRVTFTDPEIASIGLSEVDALTHHRGVKILRWPLSENDRAQAERQTEGFLKAIVDAKGYILGVTIVAHNAGELLTPWTLAKQQRLKITAMTEIVFPYPTYSEVTKRAATAFLLPQLRRPALQRLLKTVRWFG